MPNKIFGALYARKFIGAFVTFLLYAGRDIRTLCHSDIASTSHENCVYIETEVAPMGECFFSFLQVFVETVQILNTRSLTATQNLLIPKPRELICIFETYIALLCLTCLPALWLVNHAFVSLFFVFFACILLPVFGELKKFKSWEPTLLPPKPNDYRPSPTLLMGPDFRKIIKWS